MTKPITRRKLKKLLALCSPQDLAQVMLENVCWDRLMLAFSNIAWFKAQGFKKKAQKRAWVGKGRVFHRAMDEHILSRAKGGAFKISRRDVYECKCKKRFAVDAATNKNIAWDLSQCEYVVTCPHCGKQEDVRKAQAIFKKLESEPKE